jgi:hypothetical protein
MPATESLTQSIGTPQTYRLLDGRVVELRNGCLVEFLTREVVTGSHQTAGYLLDHAKLTNDERLFWSVWGDILCDRMSSQASMGQCSGGLRRSGRIAEKMEAA